MVRSGLFTVSGLVIFSTILYACAGQVPIPTATQFPSTETSTPSPIPATSTLTSTPTNTSTPEPTPIPGELVYPISSLGNSIPWLPNDDDNKPMTVYYGFNVEKPPFDNVLVRQAFAAAVDREQVAQKALEYYFRNAAPATSLTPTEILSRDLYNDVGIPFDPSRAKDLLLQAGYSDVEDFPSTTLLISVRGKAAPGAYYQMAKMIVDMWQTNLGVTVDIETAEIKSYWEIFAINPPDIYQLGWVADYKDPDNFLKDLFHSNSEVNFGHFNSEEFDRLVDEAARQTNPEKRLLLYIQAEQILAEQEVGLIPLYHSYVPVPYGY